MSPSSILRSRTKPPSAMLEIGRIIEHAVHADAALRRDDPLAVRPSAHRRRPNSSGRKTESPVSELVRARDGRRSPPCRACGWPVPAPSRPRHCRRANRAARCRAVAAASGHDRERSATKGVRRLPSSISPCGRDHLRAIRAAMAAAERHQSGTTLPRARAEAAPRTSKNAKASERESRLVIPMTDFFAPATPRS